MRRSSNSPRYFEPASSEPMSRAITRRSRSDSGTSPSTMRWARPSTIAVLPTPGSPIRTGLFLVRRESTWITRRISSSRPMTGSSLPCSASAVRSRPNFSSACDGVLGVGRVDPVRADHLVDRLRMRVAVGKHVGDAGLGPRPSRAAVLGRDVCRPSAAASRSAAWRVWSRARLGRGLGGLRHRSDRAGRRSSRWPGAQVAEVDADPLQDRHREAVGLGEQARAAGGRALASGLPAAAADCCAAATASWLLIVNRSGCIAGGS